MSEEQMPKNYKLLKGIVITLGILIIVMVIVLIVASIMKYNNQKRAEAALVEKYRASTPQQTNSVSHETFEMDLLLENGQQIISAESGEAGILIRIGTNGVTNKIIIVNDNGNITGTINIK